MRRILFVVVMLMLSMGGFTTVAYADMTEKGMYEIDLKIKDGNIKKGKNIVLLTVRSAEGKAVEGAKINITPWMPMHKHGTPYISKVHDLGKGKYKTNIPLTMPGKWIFTVTVTTDAGEDKAVFKFPPIKE